MSDRDTDWPKATDTLLFTIVYIPNDPIEIGEFWGIVSAVDAIQTEIDDPENEWDAEMFTHGEGIYLFSARWIPPETTEYGYITCPGYYDIMPAGFRGFEEAERIDREDREAKP